MSRLRNYLQKCNITAVTDWKTALISALPLLILPILNLLPLFLHGFGVIHTVPMRSVLLILLWVLVEEIIFRGILPVVAMERLKLNTVQSAIAVSVLFMLFHFAGILNGAELPYATVQSVLAFGAGFTFTALTFRCRSILPAAIIHFLLNLSADLCVNNSLPWLIWCGISALCAVYGGYLLRLEKRSIIHEAIY